MSHNTENSVQCCEKENSKDKPQKPNKFDKLLPYYKTTFKHESDQHILKFINSLIKSFEDAKFRPDSLHYIMQIYLYILRHGMTFNKETHVHLILLLYELISNCDVDHDILDLSMVLLDELLRKKECLEPGTDLELNYRPLLNIYNWAIIDIESDSKANYGLLHLPKNFTTHIGNLIRSARVYFLPGTWLEICDVLKLGYLLPFDGTKMEQQFHLLELFTPSIFKTEEQLKEELKIIEGVVEKGDNMLKRLCDYFQSFEVITPWDCHLVTLFARIANDNVGRIEWPLRFIDFFFSKFLASLSLPLSGLNISIQAVKKGLGATAKIPVTDTAKWMIYSMHGQGLNDEISLNFKFQDKSSHFNYKVDCPIENRLARLLGAMETFLHPSNSGKWTGSLVKFINALVNNMSERIYLERHKKYTWESPISQTVKISDDQLFNFVALLKPAVFLLMFDKQYYRNITTTIKSLVSMAPNLLLPSLFEKILSSFEVILEPHRLRSCLTVASALALPLTTTSYRSQDVSSSATSLPYTSYAILFDLLNYALTGIDPNDLFKCSSCLLLISTIASLLPMTDVASSYKLFEDNRNNLDGVNSLCTNSTNASDTNTCYNDYDMVNLDVARESVVVWQDETTMMDDDYSDNGFTVVAPGPGVGDSLNKDVPSSVSCNSTESYSHVLLTLPQIELLNDSGHLFQQFILNMLDKCFVLANSMDNSTLDYGGFITSSSNLRNMREELKGGTGGLGAQKNRDETSLSFSIMSAIETVLRQCSPTLYQIALNYAMERLKGILYSSKSARDAISDLCLGICIANPRIGIPILMPYLINRLTQCIDELPCHEPPPQPNKDGFVSISSNTDESYGRDEPECMWYAQILASITKRTGSEPLLSLQTPIINLLKKGIKVDSLSLKVYDNDENEISIGFNHPFLSIKNDIFEMCVEFLSNTLNCLTKVYVSNYSSLNPQDQSHYFDLSNGKSIPSATTETNPFAYWGKLYLQKEVKLEWHKPSIDSIQFSQLLIQTFLDPCLAYIDKISAHPCSSISNKSPIKKTPSMTAGAARKEILRRCLCVVEKCFVGCAPISLPLTAVPYKNAMSTSDSINRRTTSTFSSKNNSAPVINWWNHNTQCMYDRFSGLAYPVLTTICIDNKYKKPRESFKRTLTAPEIWTLLSTYGFGDVRSKIFSSIHRLLHVLLERYPDEDYVSQGYVVNIYRHLLFYRGYRQKDIEAKFQVFKFLKSYFGDKIRFPKRLPRFAFAVRAQIQHEIYCNKHMDSQFLSNDKEPSYHLDITADILKLAFMASYTGVREKCLSLLDDIMWRWKYVSHAYTINWLYASIGLNFTISDEKSRTNMFQIFPSENVDDANENSDNMSQLNCSGEEMHIDKTLKNLHLNNNVQTKPETEKILNASEERTGISDIVDLSFDGEMQSTEDYEKTINYFLNFLKLNKSTEEEIDRISETSFALICGRGGIAKSSSKGNHVEGSDNCLGATNFVDDNYKVWRLLFEIPLSEKNQIIEIFDDSIDSVFEENLINLKRYYYISDKIIDLLPLNHNMDLSTVNLIKYPLVSVPKRVGTRMYPNFVTNKPLFTHLQDVKGRHSGYHRMPVPALSYFDRLKEYLIEEALPIKGIQNWRYRFMTYHALADCVIYREIALDPDLAHSFFNGLAVTVSDDSPLIRELFLSNCCTLLKILKYDFDYPKLGVYITDFEPLPSTSTSLDQDQQVLSEEEQTVTNVYVSDLQLEQTLTYNPEVTKDIHVHKIYAGYVNHCNPLWVKNHHSNALSSGNTRPPLIKTLDNGKLDDILLNLYPLPFIEDAVATIGSKSQSPLNLMMEYGTDMESYFKKMPPYYKTQSLIRGKPGIHAKTFDVIYKVCSNPIVVETTFSKLLESEDTDIEFDALRVNFFKGLFRNNGPSLTSVYLDYIKCKLFNCDDDVSTNNNTNNNKEKDEKVVSSNLTNNEVTQEGNDTKSNNSSTNSSGIAAKRFKNKANKPVTAPSLTTKKKLSRVKASTKLSVHCLAAEIVCAWLRATKYWSFQHAQIFYQTYKDFMENILKSLTPENILFWRCAFDAACLNRDPNHLSWLIEHIVSLGLSFFPVPLATQVSNSSTTHLTSQVPKKRNNSNTTSISDKKCTKVGTTTNANKRKYHEEGSWSTLTVSYTLEIVFDVMRASTWRIKELHAKLFNHLLAAFFDPTQLLQQQQPLKIASNVFLSKPPSTDQPLVHQPTNSLKSVSTCNNEPCYSDYLYNYRSKNFQTALSQIIITPILFLNPFWNSPNYDFEKDQNLFSRFVLDLLLPSLVLYLKFPPKDSGLITTTKSRVSPSSSTNNSATKKVSSKTLTLGQKEFLSKLPIDAEVKAELASTISDIISLNKDASAALQVAGIEIDLGSLTSQIKNLTGGIKSSDPSPTPTFKSFLSSDIDSSLAIANLINNLVEDSNFPSSQSAGSRFTFPFDSLVAGVDRVEHMSENCEGEISDFGQNAYLNTLISRLHDLNLNGTDSERVENHVKIMIKALLCYFILNLHPFNPRLIALLPVLFYLDKRVQYSDAQWSAEIYTTWAMMSRTLLPDDINMNGALKNRTNKHTAHSCKSQLLHVLAKEFVQTPLWRSRTTIMLYLRNNIFCDFLFDSRCDACKQNIWKFCLAGLVDPVVEVRENSRDTLSGFLRCKYFPFIDTISPLQTSPEKSYDDRKPNANITVGGSNIINNTIASPNRSERVQPFSKSARSLVSSLTRLLNYNGPAVNTNLKDGDKGFYYIDNDRYDPPSLLHDLIYQNDISYNHQEDSTHLPQMHTEPGKATLNYNYYSGGVLGLCAIVEAFPYDIPRELPAILIKLSTLTHKPLTKKNVVKNQSDITPTSSSSTIGSNANKITDIQLIRKTMANFKRTHLDNWQDHKSNFTDEELEILSDLLVSPNYYA